MWAQIPERNVFLLSTIKTRGENAGIILNSVYGEMVVYWYTGLTSYNILATATLMGLNQSESHCLCLSEHRGHTRG